MVIIQATITGVLIFIAGQYLLRFVLEPIIELRRNIGRTINIVIVNWDVLTVPSSVDKKFHEQAIFDLQKARGALIEGIAIIPKYKLIYNIFCLPPEKTITSVERNLDKLIGTSIGNAPWKLEQCCKLCLLILKDLNSVIPEKMIGATGNLDNKINELDSNISAKKHNKC